MLFINVFFSYQFLCLAELPNPDTKRICSLPRLRKKSQLFNFHSSISRISWISVPPTPCPLLPSIPSLEGGRAEAFPAHPSLTSKHPQPRVGTGPGLLLAHAIPLGHIHWRHFSIKKGNGPHPKPGPRGRQMEAPSAQEGATNSPHPSTRPWLPFIFPSVLIFLAKPVFLLELF